jgi:hypothetical protein
MSRVVAAVLVCVAVAACGDVESERGRGLADLTAGEGEDGSVGELAEGDASAPVEQPAGDAGDALGSDAAMPESDAGALPGVDAGSEPEPVQLPPCTMRTWYRDADGDGYGHPAVTVQACTAQAGFVGNAGDCYDGSNLAYPSSPHAGGVENRGDGSFDFDCDGVETLVKQRVAVCPAFTTDDNRCPPQINRSSLWSDDLPASECEARENSWYDARSGWLGQLPPCGAIAQVDLYQPFSRQTGYTCQPTGRVEVASCR